MRIVFRVDASLQIGTGHIMRCLSLAHILKENGSSVDFICCNHKGNLVKRIRSEGFNVFVLKLPMTKNIDNKLFHSDWLGSTQEEDARSCLNLLQQQKIDWIIVDHYGIDEDWEQKLQPIYNKLMVIDDLANRNHQCDVLLDQTFGRDSQDYKKLVPKSCSVLLGSQYALLRPEFAEWRQHSLKRRINREFKKLIINMGGIDQDNVTLKVLKELIRCNLPNDINITIVMGDNSPHQESVKSLVDTLPYKASLKIGVHNMAEIMANADIAIGGGGSSTWERSCLGLPTIQIVLAENQADIARNLNSIKAIKLLNKISQLSENIEDILKISYKLSLVSSAIVDGDGTARVAKFIDSKTINIESFLIRPAELCDSDFTYSLQTKEVRKFSVNTEVPSQDQHINWFQNKINSPNSLIYILVFETVNAGILRVDNLNTDELEISIIVSSRYRGRNFAEKALKKLESLVFNKRLKAIIHKENIASQKVFIRAGFKLHKQYGDFSEYYCKV
jgi:UDP-2,4-diacetamido-2,4,6-trideoxy-beta-L-altropyranose hydrolase